MKFFISSIKQFVFGTMLGVTLLAVTLAEASANILASDIVQPRILPGYAPGKTSKMDERGLWLAMQEAERELTRSPLVMSDGPLIEYIRELGCQVAQSYCNDIRIYIIRNPTFNASMAPNGTMLMHTGLIVRVTSPDHLAAIIGHEIAHYTQTHSIRRWRAAKSRMTIGMLVSIGLGGAGIGTGGLPELFAISSVMGFSRAQETEADVLGTHFMSIAGFDPNASSEVWRMLEQEEEQASTKRPKGAFFLQSHPAPKKRALKLTRLADDMEAQPHVLSLDPENDFLSIIEDNYTLLLEEQLQQGDHGRIDALLDRHAKMGVSPTKIAYYRGEAWRLRGGAGDHQHAIESYRRALSLSEENANAHKQLGYLLYKHEGLDVAKAHFQRYLDLCPNASDKDMIQFYLEEG